MTFNDDLLSKFIATEITRFTEADIPDITSEFPEVSHWLQNHFLNNVFRSAFEDRARQVALGYRVSPRLLRKYALRVLTSERGTRGRSRLAPIAVRVLKQA
jgi:hypothetical protein